MTDALSIARDLIRCASVTPADAGARGVLEKALAAAGFACHRVTKGQRMRSRAMERATVMGSA